MQSVGARNRPLQRRTGNMNLLTCMQQWPKPKLTCLLKFTVGVGGCRSLTERHLVVHALHLRLEPLGSFVSQVGGVDHLSRPNLQGG